MDSLQRCGRAPRLAVVERSQTAMRIDHFGSQSLTSHAELLLSNSIVQKGYI